MAASVDFTSVTSAGRLMTWGAFKVPRLVRGYRMMSFVNSLTKVVFVRNVSLIMKNFQLSNIDRKRMNEAIFSLLLY